MTLRVVAWSTGNAGKAAIAGIDARPELELVGVWVSNPDKVGKDAGELAAAGVHILGKTIAEVADAWAPYLTMAEGIRIVAKSFTTDVSKLSCCA